MSGQPLDASQCNRGLEAVREWDISTVPGSRLQSLRHATDES